MTAFAGRFSPVLCGGNWLDLACIRAISANSSFGTSWTWPLALMYTMRCDLTSAAPLGCCSCDYNVLVMPSACCLDFRTI